MAEFTVWRLADGELDLWLPTVCDTFDQAAQAWLDVISSGGRARIMEDVPVVLQDARQKKTRPAPVAPVKPQTSSMAARVIDALRAAPDGLSRSQLASQTGMTKTDVGATAAGLMKRGVVRSERRPPDKHLGRPAPGHDTIAVYVLEARDAELS